MGLVKPVWPVVQRGHPLARGLISAWPFYEGAGGVLHDLSGNRNAGTFVNSPNWVGGPSGSALSFTNAGAQSVGMTGRGQIVTLAAGTVHWWQYNNVAFNNNTNVQMPFGVAGNPISGEFSAQKYLDGNLYFGWSLTTDTRVIVAADAVNWPQNQWTNYTITYVNGGLTSLWVNAVKVKDNAGGTITSLITNSPEFDLAKQGATAFDGFDGLLDGFLVFDRVLSAAEIAQLYFDPFAIYREPSRWWETATAAAPPAYVPYNPWPQQAPVLAQ